MIPEIKSSLIDEERVERQQPSLTWKLDLEKGKITGKTDGLEAVKQAVLKSLQTDRFWYEIYTWDYGHELTSLIGSSPVFVESEAKRIIEEALMIDDRINGIENFTISVNGDQLTINFTVTTIYGSFEYEVRNNV